MEKKIKLISFLFVIIIILVLHSTPHLALRTHLFFIGYPKAALTSNIIDDEYHNKVDQQKFNKINAKAYTLTEPPIETATQGELRNFLVRKFGFLYVAEYYGDV